jgi:hypothetical protein
MERLTFEGNFCDIAQCRELPCPYDGNCTQKQVWERLKAYEDSRLSPQACAEAREIEETLSGCGCSISRMVELMKADKDGRVLILPCKLGTKVYRIRYKIVDYPGKPEPEITTTWFTPEYREDIGRTVFFTREEAEKALQEMEDKA